MKNGTKKWLSVLLAALMGVSSMATFAAADAPEEDEHSAAEIIYVGQTELSDGEWTADGVSDSTSALPESGYAYYKDGVLTLNNFEYEGYGYFYYFSYYLIFSSGTLTLNLIGDNTLVADPWHTGIMTSMDLTVNGTGSLDVQADMGGIYSYSDIAINSSSIEITADYQGIYAQENISITSNSDVTINMESDNGYDALYAGNNVTIKESALDITTFSGHSHYYGIYADNTLEITDSIVNISSKCNGISACHDYSSDQNISITDSAVTIEAYYDGIFVPRYDWTSDPKGDFKIKGNSLVAVASEKGAALNCEFTSDSNLDVLYESEAGVVCIGSKDLSQHDHDFSDVRYDINSHWKVCSEDDCYIPKIPAFFPYFGEHADINGDNKCDVDWCGEEYSDLVVGNHYLSDGEYLSNDGVIYTANDEDKPDSGYAHYDENTNTLTLNNFEYRGKGYEYKCESGEDSRNYYYSLISFDGNLNIVLEGDNFLRTKSNYYAYDKVDNVDIFHYFNGIVADSITLSGDENSTLSVDASYDGIYAEGNISITGSTADITAEDNGIDATGNVTISDSTVTITSSDAGLEAGGFIRSMDSFINITSNDEPAFVAYGNIEIDNLPDDVSVKYFPEEGAYYTLVDLSGNPLYNVVIEPEEEKESSPIPKNLQNIRVSVNGKGGTAEGAGKNLIGALGSRRTFKFTPDEGCRVADVIVNGKSVGAVEKYTIVITGPMTIEVSFEEIEG